MGKETTDPRPTRFSDLAIGDVFTIAEDSQGWPQGSPYVRTSEVTFRSTTGRNADRAKDWRIAYLDARVNKEVENG